MGRQIQRGKSPTEELLDLWSQGNHTVLELFLLLGRMKHYRAMTVIKDLIDPKYHRLIKDNERNLSELMNDIKVNTSVKKLNVEVPQIYVSNEDNESIQQPKEIPKPRSPLLNSKLLLSDISCVASSASAIPQIPYEELMKSTNNWDKTKVLGRGGFGIVFRGTWKCTQVAIKRIEKKDNDPESNFQQIKQSITELHCLNAYRHDNVLPLYG